MDMSKYRGMFISETKEHLQNMNSLIVSLEKDPSNHEDIEALFRVAHSVKGMAASMGYHDIADLSHKMEDMMDLFRKGEIELSSSTVDLLFEGLDSLEIMVKGIEDDDSIDLDLESLLNRMTSLKEDSPAVKTGAKPDKKGGRIFSVFVKIDGNAEAPGVRAYLAYKKLSALGKILSSEPEIEEVKSGRFGGEVVFTFHTDSDEKNINDVLNSIPELESFTISKGKDVPDRKSSLKMHTPESFQDISAGKEEIEKKENRKGHQVRTVRVTTDLLDSLINIVGEMIISRSRLFELGKEITSAPLKESMAEMSNLIRNLYGQVMSVRMIPIENVMERLPRVVRDLARTSGKKAELEIEGKDIELDRAIVEEMGDPLVHILRNCVDHGLETSDERKKKGKDPAGHILIRAMREKDQVIINIQDDGRGMDAEKIKQKAIERGLITRERAKSMNDHEALMLVCHSGLSTAEKVTDVSGRGVGMDAVRNVVDSIGGSMDIDSVKDEGTSITLKLPLTVAIVQVLLVRIGGEIFAIPINKIIRTVEVHGKDVKKSQRQIAFMLDDELIPLLSLRKILKYDRPESPTPLIYVAVVEMKNRKVGLVVDSLIGQQEAFVKPLDPPMEWVKGFSGATILGDGSVSFVLDIPNLI